MGSFKKHINETNKKIIKETFENISEASIYEPKYPFGHKVILKTNEVDSFNNKLKKPIENGIFIKVKETSKAEELSYGSGVEIWLQHEATKRVFHITGTASNLRNKFNHVKSTSGINWQNTPTLETAQCLGIFIDGNKMLSDIGAEKNAALWKAEVKKALGTATDWNTEGVNQILKNIDTVSLGDLLQIALLAAGSTTFKKAIAPSFNNIIHGKITDYYKAEEMNPFIETKGAKANTADAILSTVPADQLIDAIKTKKVTANKTGICTCGDIKFVQMSLKKGKGKAQLGKFMTAIQQKYNIPKFIDLLQISLDENVIEEGLFGDIVKSLQNVGSKIYQALGSAISALSNLMQGTVQKMNSMVPAQQKKDFADLERKLGVPAGHFTECFKQDDKGNLIIENNQLVLEKQDSLTDRLLGLTMKQQNDLLDSVNERLKNFEKKAKTTSTLLFTNRGFISGFKKAAPMSSVIKLFANYTAAYIYEQMVIQHAKSSQNLIESLIDIQREIFFGKTGLPIYKVYGAGSVGDTDTYEYLGSPTDFVDQKAKELSKRKEIAVAFRSAIEQQSKDYYVFMSHILSGMNEEGEWEYSELRMGTNQGSTSFAFVLEGVKITTFDRMIKSYA